MRQPLLQRIGINILRLFFSKFLLLSVASLLVFALPVTRLYAATGSIQYQYQTIQVEGSAQRVRIPEGYLLEVLTDQLNGPRLMTFATNGDLLIGSRSGHVYRLAPPYHKPRVLIDTGDYPHSVALRDKQIWIAKTGGLYRAPYNPGQRLIDPHKLKLVARLPSGPGHSSRTVAVGPDGRIYVSLGISSNCSNQYLDTSYPFARQRGGMFVLKENSDGDTLVPFASGLRNPVGFDWNPVTHVMYASNNGPDHLGFDQPPEYFSKVLPGSFHGMPWFQYDGRRIHRDDCIGTPPPRPISDVVPPVATFPARNAPMGVVFVTKGAMDPQFTGDAVVALHGSWATRPSGGAFGSRATRRPPKLVVVRFRDGTAVRVNDLVTGFQLKDGSRWARPVGVAIGPDGALYFTSDSDANALFRLRRK
jgi:glucose/arabinose dehydrogenase